MNGFFCFILLALSSISLVLADDVVVKDEWHFPTAWATEISPLCYNDSQSYFQSYLKAEKWASKSNNFTLKSFVLLYSYSIMILIVYKATGFLSLKGLKNIESFAPSAGLFDLCLSLESPSFQGQYCSAFFKFEPVEMIGNSSNISTSKGVQEQDGDSNTYRLPRVGFCIPSSCSATDFRSSVVQLVNREVNIGVMMITIISRTHE